MTIASSPSWHFAPTGGGAEQGNSAGQHHFTNEAVTQTVREVLQNSVDHPDPGIDTIEVKFRLIELQPEDAGMPQLKRHIESSLLEVTKDKDTEAVRHYQRMIKTVSQPVIPCLAITDSGTTGLQGINWRNLIFREGTPTNAEGRTKGGSYGFGKNAPFNLSECNTVLYSTRYVSTAKKGRVEHLAGRSQLVTHNNPEQPEERLQQTGFWAIHSETPNQPVQGTDIPQPLRLEQKGTGIFIVGFDKDIYPNWAAETAQAVVTQFFHAIHTRRLAVVIKENPYALPRVIDYNSLPIELDNLPPDRPTRHYWQAITDNDPVLTQPSGRLDQMGQLQVWISTAKGAPRRTAHINRRGMLITDERTHSTNPFYPSGGTGWPEWCAVTIAQDESTEAYIRAMEPPAHDAIKYGQLRDSNRKRAAEREVRAQREQITRLIKERIEDTLTEANSNVEELAELFPDLPDIRQGTHDLKWKERQYHEPSSNIVDETSAIEDPDSEPGTLDPEGDHRESSEREDENDENFNEPEIPRTSPKPDEHTIRHARIIRTGPDELAMTFTTPPQPTGTIRFRIKAAGEQYQKYEESIPLAGITQTGSLLTKAGLNGNIIEVTAPPDTPVTLRLTLDSGTAPYHSYSIAQFQTAGQ